MDSSNKVGGNYNVAFSDPEKIDQQKTSKKESKDKKSVLALLKIIYELIKSWLGRDPDQILERKIKDIVASKNPDRKMANLADVIKEITQVNPSKLKEIRIEFNEHDKECAIIIGDEANKINFKPIVKDEDDIVQDLVKPDLEEGINHVRDTMLQDYKRKGVRLKIFGGDRVFDVEKSVDDILNKSNELESDNHAQEEYLNEGAQKIKDEVLEVYDLHMSTDITRSRVFLEQMSTQVASNPFLYLCYVDFPKSGEDEIYVASSKGYAVDVYQVAQQDFFVDLTINLSSIRTLGKSADPSRVESKHRFQTIISPEGFHLIGKQSDVSKFPEYRHSR